MSDKLRNAQLEHEKEVALAFQEFAADCANPKVTAVCFDYRKKQQIPVNPYDEKIDELDRVARLALSNMTITTSEIVDEELIDRHIYSMSLWPNVPRDAGGTTYHLYSGLRILAQDNINKNKKTILRCYADNSSLNKAYDVVKALRLLLIKDPLMKEAFSSVSLMFFLKGHTDGFSQF